MIPLGLLLASGYSAFSCYLTFSGFINLGETVFCCGLDEVFLCENVPLLTVYFHCLWCKNWFWYDITYIFSSEYADHYHLDRVCGWYWRIRMGLLCSLAVLALSQVGCFPVVGVEALRVEHDQFPLQFIYPVPRGDCWSKCLPYTHRGLMHHLYRHPWLHSDTAQRHVPCSVMFTLDVLQGYGMEWAVLEVEQLLCWDWELGCCGCRNWDGHTAARDLGCLCSSLLPGPFPSVSSLQAVRWSGRGQSICSAGRGTAVCSWGTEWALTMTTSIWTTPKGCPPPPHFNPSLHSSTASLPRAQWLGWLLLWELGVWWGGSVPVQSSLHLNCWQASTVALLEVEPRLFSPYFFCSGSLSTHRGLFPSCRTLGLKTLYLWLNPLAPQGGGLLCGSSFPFR